MICPVYNKPKLHREYNYYRKKSNAVEDVLLITSNRITEENKTISGDAFRKRSYDLFASYMIQGFNYPDCWLACGVTIG